MPQQSSPFVLTPPDDLAAEDWLIQLDSRPSAVPTWPASSRLTLVAVVVKGYGLATESPAVAYVLTEMRQADGFINFSKDIAENIALFFTVPKTRVITCCDGLTPEAWQAQ